MKRFIAVIGLGYVGLPVAVSFARHGFQVVGFDINEQRIEELNRFYDRTRECDEAELKQANCFFTHKKNELAKADFFIVTVPTPIDDAYHPDMTALRKASHSIGEVLKKGDIVVYESTVYPGATEEVCVPILEQVSKLKFGIDFTVGYSPERINPGDKQHRFETIKKVTSGSDPKTADIIAETYGQVVKAGIHKATSIKVAEAAKVIENTQRYINIGFVNELSAIFGHLGIDTLDVLEAAGTKWNFLPFKPGLVGGHCIGVDPFYLTYQAERHGYKPEIILSGRQVNDALGARIAHECVKSLLKMNVSPKIVTVLGITFKENVPDIRNSKVAVVIRELQSFGIEVQVADPVAQKDEVLHEYGVVLTDFNQLKPADAVICAVRHDDYYRQNWALVEKLLINQKGLVMDVKGYLPREGKPSGVNLWRL